MTFLSPEEAEAKYPGPKEFVHLHTHTIFSALDGCATPEEYISRCAKHNMPAIAMTDHGSLASFPDAYFAAKKHNIKMIPGVEAYYNDKHPQLVKFQESGYKWADLKKLDEEAWERLRKNRHITILARNQIGYKNLIHITSNAWEIGFYYKPRIWFNKIKERKEGLIILSGCINGPISYEITQYLEKRDEKYLRMALNELKRFKNEFGDDFYVEIQMPGPDLEESIPLFKILVTLAKKLRIKFVLTNDSHFMDSSDYETQRMMMAIDQNLTIDSPDIFGANSEHQFLKTRAQLRQTFNEYYNVISADDFEKACDNTLEIASKCETFTPDLEPKLPSIDNAEEVLTNIIMDKLKEKGLYNSTKKYLVDNKMVTHREQVQIELDRIIEKGFAPYFLITMDLVQYARDKFGEVGPGRGSAGGSLVSYLLGIHSIDPLKFGLSFARFMSPSRGGYMLDVNME